MLKNDIELLNGSESWNRTLAQTLIPDFQPLKENSMLGSKSLENGYATRASSNPPPDIHSSHFTISPIKHELVHVDLLEGKGRIFKSRISGKFILEFYWTLLPDKA